MSLLYIFVVYIVIIYYLQYKATDPSFYYVLYRT